MEVVLCENAGFCFGVKRAVDTVYELCAHETGKSIYTYGPIVHNDRVVTELAALGVTVIRDEEELRNLKERGALDNSCIVIRAHGISDPLMAEIESIPGVSVTDATCPYVRKIHEIVREHERKGERIVVTGDPDHPEVKGITGCLGKEALVIRTAEEARILSLPEDTKICVVSQTTFHQQKFEDIVEILKKKLYDISVVNTICNATQRRQSETAEIARKCDAMIVIGSRSSSNSRKLFDIAESECRATYFIQCLDDLKLLTIDNSVRCIGITAGASTPKTIIEEVLNYVRTEF